MNCTASRAAALVDTDLRAGVEWGVRRIMAY